MQSKLKNLIKIPGPLTQRCTTRCTVLDLSWKICNSEPCALKTGPLFWIFREISGSLTQRHTKGPQFWIFSKYLNLWTMRRRKKGPLFWILISIPLSHVSERKVHNFGCFVEYHGPLSHAPERKVHNFGSFVKYLDLSPSGLPKRSTILDVLLNIWRSKPRPLEKGPTFCIFFKKLNLWATQRRKRSTILNVL